MPYQWKWTPYCNPLWVAPIAYGRMINSHVHAFTLSLPICQQAIWLISMRDYKSYPPFYSHFLVSVVPYQNCEALLATFKRAEGWKFYSERKWFFLLKAGSLNDWSVVTSHLHKTVASFSLCQWKLTGTRATCRYGSTHLTFALSFSPTICPNSLLKVFCVSIVGNETICLYLRRL